MVSECTIAILIVSSFKIFFNIFLLESTDDDKIVSYKWEELKGPIKENTIFTSSDKKILELKNLVAGVYKFK